MGQFVSLMGDFSFDTHSLENFPERVNQERGLTYQRKV